MTDSIPETRKAVSHLAHKLLDIGKRNRLIHTPLGRRRAKQLDIEDERADEVFGTLARDNRAMAFEPNPKSDSMATDDWPDRAALVPGDAPGFNRADEGAPLPVGASNSTPLADHHTDLKLRTRLASEALQKRLLSIYREARTIEEEQGVSVLFLAVGFLEWYESESSTLERYAPLVLVPVDLHRTTVRSGFKLRYRDQDVQPNLSLTAMLKADFGIKLPELPDGDAWLPSQYFRSVDATVSGQVRWRVLPDVMELSFFSFGKFLMHRDLTADVDWGEGASPSDHPVLTRLLVGGEVAHPNLLTSAELLDRRFPDPRALGHVMDADASQTQVIAAARDGQDLVVQGPPGTGKSQTITNIVAVAAKEGKRVLFVAEKRAALDVVHERLKGCGLGPLCLELHSSGANKQNVYGDLARTLSLGSPAPIDESVFTHLREVRDDLNRMSDLLHDADETTGATPYGIIGDLSYWSDGADPPDFAIPECDRWSLDEWKERIRATDALATLTGEYGPEASHPWRGATRRLTEMDQRRLAGHLVTAAERLTSLEAALLQAAVAAGLIARRADGLPSAWTPSHAGWVAKHLEALDTMPEAVPQVLCVAELGDGSAKRLAAASQLVRDIADVQALRAEALAVVDVAALSADWTDVVLALRASGRSMFRWLSGDYRRATRRLRSVMVGELPKDVAGRLSVAERLAHGVVDLRARQEAVASREELGRALFDSHWRQSETDVGSVWRALRWLTDQTALLEAHPGPAGSAMDRSTATVSLSDVARQIEASQTYRRATDQDPAAALRRAADEWTGAWQVVAADVGLHAQTAFSAEVDCVALADLRERLAVWTGHLGRIEEWHRLRTAGVRASELGLSELRDRVGEGGLAPAEARGALDLVRGEAVWRRMVNENPELAILNGADRTAKVERFRDLDGELQRIASREVALRHFQRLPTGGAGQVGIVRGEIAKKRRHMPIRRLLESAGEAVVAIKPVFLMSPLSVAQYLAPGGLRFDLVLIDEASQMRPEDAAGAILRGDQIVVVGDQKQLPPSSFFDRQVAGGDEAGEPPDEADVLADQVGEMESILSLCEARNLAGGMLRWHYRSRHPSLIQVSNQEFYESKLAFPPSPDRAGRDAGLTFRHVEDGCYDRGGRRNNLPEATVVAEAVLGHARVCPDETLGVVAMSVAQRDTILDQMEVLRGQHPELDRFCREGRHEPFFVKNLENVQGDERDVILISIGYGRDENGYLAQSFGPISAEGGERRLNVLFTRAKRRCTIFSTMRHDDIRLQAAKRPGPRVLKGFLKFAETGESDLATPSGEEMDSPFEASVAATLLKHNYQVTAQLGSAGFRLDLVVHDPDDDGRYLLAVECDGARYHSSSWARERDRLRQTVLEGKGWRFHRIWSTDWFYNRQAEVDRLLAAIEQARNDARAAGDARGAHVRDADPAEQSPSPFVAGLSPADAADDLVPRLPHKASAELGGVAYREADFVIAEANERIEDVSRGVVAHYVARIVATEGPVSIAEVVRRLTRLWGCARTGSRIRGAIERAVTAAVRAGTVRYSAGHGFLDRPDATKLPQVRDRSEMPAAARQMDRLPPTEVQQAIRQTVEQSVSVSVEQCVVEVARMMGYRRTPSGFHDLVASEARQLVAIGALVEKGGELRIGQRHAASETP